MRVKIIFIILVLLCYSGLVLSSGTLNVEVRPQVLFSNISVGQEVPVQLTIVNNENSTTNIEIHVELPSDVLITSSYMVDSTGSIVISSLTLKPYESRTVLFTIMVSRPGTYTIPVIVLIGNEEKMTYLTMNVSTGSKVEIDERSSFNIPKLDLFGVFVLVFEGGTVLFTTLRKVWVG